MRILTKVMLWMIQLLLSTASHYWTDDAAISDCPVQVLSALSGQQYLLEMIKKEVLHAIAQDGAHHSDCHSLK